MQQGYCSIESILQKHETVISSKSLKEKKNQKVKQYNQQGICYKTLPTK